MKKFFIANILPIICIVPVTFGFTYEFCYLNFHVGQVYCRKFLNSLKES